MEISKDKLSALYLIEKRSVANIARLFSCSQNRINYWLTKYEIKKRTISEAIYHLRNPSGDPFSVKKPRTIGEGILFGLGLGLYWGEGLKRGAGGVRLTNTDVNLIKKFVLFLEKFCGIDRNKLRFSIQIFDDISPQKALNYWSRELKVTKKQFYKIIISKVRGSGTYKYRSEHGVVIVYFNNVKLKRVILEMIEKNY